MTTTTKYLETSGVGYWRFEGSCALGGNLHQDRPASIKREVSSN